MAASKIALLWGGYRLKLARSSDLAWSRGIAHVPELLFAEPSG